VTAVQHPVSILEHAIVDKQTQELVHLVLQWCMSAAVSCQLVCTRVCIGLAHMLLKLCSCEGADLPAALEPHKHAPSCWYAGEMQ
jgi:hypothetical protein